MVDFTGVDGTMSLNDVQRMQGGGPPGHGDVDYEDVKQAYLNNSEEKNVWLNSDYKSADYLGGNFTNANTMGRSVVFEVIVTVPDYEWQDPPDNPVGDQKIYSASFDLRDMVTEDGRWTPMATTPEWYDSPKTPMGAALNNAMSMTVTGFASDYLQPLPNGNHIMSGDYDDILDSLGVTPRRL